MSADEPMVNQRGAQERPVGDATTLSLQVAFAASGGSSAEWELIKDSAVMRWMCGAGRSQFWEDLDRYVLGGVWENATPEVRAGVFKAGRGEVEPGLPEVLPRLAGWAGPVPRVTWMAPRWSNARLGAEGVKWETALAAQAGSFDAGFARASGEDKSGVARWAHSYVRSTEHLYVSWLWELYIDLAGRTGGWVEGLGAVAREGPPAAAGRAAWMEAHPGGLDLPEASVRWGGDIAGHAARVPFVDRAETGARATPFEGLSLVVVPGDKLVEFSVSPAIADLGMSGGGGAPIFVSRAAAAGEFWDDVVRLGAASSRPGLFDEGAMVWLVVPGLTTSELVAVWATVRLSWREGMVLPLRAIAGHVQAVARGGAREVAPLRAPRNDWAGALRLMADARVRVGGQRPVQGLGCNAYVSAFASTWRARVAAVAGLLALDDAEVAGPSGDGLDRAVALVGYELARWTDRSVQRVVGHGDNVSLVRRGGPVYRALVRAATLLPGVYGSAGAEAARVLPVLGYSVPFMERPAEPPDRLLLGSRADWSKAVVDGPSDPWADVDGGAVPPGLGGGADASSWRPGGAMSAGAGTLGPVFSRVRGGAQRVLASRLGRGGVAGSVIPWVLEVPPGFEGALVGPEELAANEFVFLSLEGSTLRRLGEVDYSCPLKRAPSSAGAEGLSF